MNLTDPLILLSTAITQALVWNMLARIPRQRQSSIRVPEFGITVEKRDCIQGHQFIIAGSENYRIDF